MTPSVRKALAFCLLALASPGWAVEYDLISPGQTYDLDVFGQFTNPQVRVLAKQQGEVTVEILEGDRTGEVLNVAPSRLLTSDESLEQEIGNVAVAAGLAVGIICELTGGCEDGGGNTEYLSATYTPGTERNVFFRNLCNRTVRMWMAYYIDGNFYGDAAAWTFAPQESAFLRTSNQNDVITDRIGFYYYAESAEGELVWAGDYPLNLSDKSFPMRLSEFSESENGYGFSVECP